MTALAFYGVFREAGVPAGVLHVVFGSGEIAGQALANHPGVDGMLFTGSKQVGMELLRRFSRDYPKPCITEMGGKNPAIVMPSADLDAAAEGVMRSAFGLSGQKCSACSRVYVHEDVRGPLHRPAAREDGGARGGRPQPGGGLPGTRDPRARLRRLRTRRRRGPARRERPGGCALPARGCFGPRLLRGPHAGGGPAEGPPPLPRRALRAFRGSGHGRLARRGHRAARTAPNTASPRASSAPSSRRSTPSWSGSRRESST